MEVNYYAGAADAAGTTAHQIDAGDLTAAELLRILGERSAHLRSVLTACSLLVDGRPVSGPGELLPSTARVDILPPFAGG